VQNTSFAAGSQDLQVLAGLRVPAKQVERLCKQIGQERVDQRQQQVQAFEALPVTAKFGSPVAHPPELAVVSMDGGRLQILDRRVSPAGDAAGSASTEGSGPTSALVATGAEGDAAGSASAEAVEHRAASQPAEARSGHWREDKIGLLMTMTSQEAATDPCPTIPETFVNPLRIPKLARAIKRGGPAGADPVADPLETDAESDLEDSAYTAPAVRVKSMVASRVEAPPFGVMLAAAAQARGFFAAQRRAFVADGAECNWTIQKRWFSDFVPILDFIHTLSYVFAAAMAGHGFRSGWAVYARWIEWVWQGRVGEVIAELEQRQEELGRPAADESEGSPRTLVADALTYLRNNQPRMRYDHYRRQGLPLTSSHMESTVKQFNRRVKGTEKFWSEAGAEALLQLRADYLSETEPLEKFWQEREAAATGRRRYRRAM
jgi:hypothetical protein